MKEESYIIVHLNRDESKKLSQALANETSRKIMDYLASKDATESQIAKALKLPQSTVHYNLKQLAEARMILAEEFHYSEKGKVVNHYRLSQKLVIIAPPQSGMESIRSRLAAIAPAILVSVVGTGLLYYFTRPKGIVDAADTGLRAVAEAEPVLMAKAAPMMDANVVASPSLFSQAWPWFLIGGLVAILVYVIADYVVKKRN
jgi:DNA-binding transcriptional ArsR family regulator